MTFTPLKPLNNIQLDRIHANKATLLQIQAITDVPWQAMAGIWFRESFSVAPPKTPGGPWQFDPPPADWKIFGLLDRFTKLSVAEKNDIAHRGVNDFYAGGIVAACLLRTKTIPVIHPGVDDAVIKDALWGYNGKAYGSADASPYVMNGYDKTHFPMHLVGSIPDGHGGRTHIDEPDYRPGAFTVYKQLKESGV